jgi:hypothetical protein
VLAFIFSMPPRRNPAVQPPRSVHFEAGAAPPPTAADAAANDAGLPISPVNQIADDAFNTSATATDVLSDPSLASPAPLSFSSDADLLSGIEHRTHEEAAAIFNRVFPPGVPSPAPLNVQYAGSSPNPFLTPSDYTAPVGNENRGAPPLVLCSARKISSFPAYSRL